MRTAVARWWTLGLSIALVAASAAFLLPTRNTNSANVTKARELYFSGLTALQAAQYERASTLFRDAWSADPSRLGALLNLSRTKPVSLPAALLRSLDSIALAQGDSLLLRCVRAIVSGFADDATARAIERSGNLRNRRCGTVLRKVFVEPADPSPIFEQYPEVPGIVGAYVQELMQRDPAAAWLFSRRMAASSAHPMLRLEGYIWGGSALHALGQHERAADWESEAEQRARGWGAGALFRFLGYLDAHVGLLDEIDASDAVAVHLHTSKQRARVAMRQLYPSLDFTGRVLVLSSLSIELLGEGSLNEALAGYDSLVRLADSARDIPFGAYAHGHRGRTLVKLGRLEEAEPALIRARDLGLASGDLFALREASHDLLHLYEGRARYDSAVAAGRDFVRYSGLLGTRPTLMMAHHDLGWVYRRNGLLDQADRAFQTMIAEIDTLENHYYWAGEYYEFAGRLERARDYYLRDEAGGRERARMRAGLVRVSEALGEVEDAKRVAYLADRDVGTWFPEYVPLLPGILARNGSIEAARSRYAFERSAARDRGKTYALAQLALESAELELRVGNSTMARELADSAAAAGRLVGATEIAARASVLAAIADLQSGTGPATAMSRLDSAVRRGDKMRIPQLSAELQLMRGDAFRRLDDIPRALASYVRAAAWVDSVASHLRSDPARAGHRASHVRVSNHALAAIVGHANYPQRISAYVSWSARRKGSSANPTAIRAAWRRLDHGAALVDYVVSDTLVAALVVTANGTTLHRLPVTADSLRARVAQFRAPIAPTVGSVIDATRIGFDSAAARDLYRDVIEPIRGQLSGINRLIIVPDGPLHMLPFDALLQPASEPRFLIDDFTIRYVTSLDAPVARAEADWLGRALAVRGPVGKTPVGAKEEIAAVTAALRSDVLVLDSIHATVEAVRAQAGHVRILHFATHAEANDVNPDFARLALAPSPRDDGWLRAFEIRTWRLAGALVVLSACQTAAGRLAVGEGTLSISRAFLQAGAGATVATLWPVGAPTAELMRVFYQQLSSGADVDEALRAARLALRKAGFSHPFYWAPFIVTTRQL